MNLKRLIYLPEFVALIKARYIEKESKYSLFWEGKRISNEILRIETNFAEETVEC